MATTITVDARPAPLQLPTQSTAVIVVDMENDFGSTGGMFDRAGIDISAIRDTVGPTRRALDVAREVGMPVIYLKMGYRADLADLGSADAPNRALHHRFGVGHAVPNPTGGEYRVLVRDEWGTEIINALQPQPGDIVVYKTRFSGFYDTELHDLLTQRGITHLVVTGCTTSVCVESTIRDAFFRDYTCVLLEDCTAEPIGAGLPRSNHDASVLLIQIMFGFVSTSDQFLKAAHGSDSLARA